jgi:DNA-directed RNA polymerase subunit alpha
MNQSKNKFFSCIDSQVLENGEFYARFHLGTFFQGQALTLANALRRTLLTEIPSLLLTRVEISGITHEFATLPGVQETVLDILLNLKKLVFTADVSDLNTIEYNLRPTKGFLKVRGPATITAGDIKLPSTVNCVSSNSYIATLSRYGELNMVLVFESVFPQALKSQNEKNLILSTPKIESLASVGDSTLEKFFEIQTIPKPIRKVNYLINQIDAKTGSEYIILEIWTDGSLTPIQILHFAFNQLTKVFYQFSFTSKNLIFN